MPTYPYECEHGHRTRIIQHMREERPETLPCSTCGATATRVFNRVHVSAFEPFVTHVGDGKPKVVRNSAEAADIEKRFNVAEITSAEMKQRADIGDMRRRRAQRAKEAAASLGPMYKDYERAEAEVKQRGTEYSKELERRERVEAEAFQKEIDSGLVNT